MAKATTTMRQVLTPSHGEWLHANQVLFNRVACFSFDVIQAQRGVLELSNKEALTALEKLTHATEINPDPIMPLPSIQEDIPALFRRAVIHAALGSARSFSATLYALDVERASWFLHHDQGLDGLMLELDQRTDHWARNSRGL